MRRLHSRVDSKDFSGCSDGPEEMGMIAVQGGDLATETLLVIRLKKERRPGPVENPSIYQSPRMRFKRRERAPKRMELGWDEDLASQQAANKGRSLGRILRAIDALMRTTTSCESEV